jgi:hypothetical protein
VSGAGPQQNGTHYLGLIGSLTTVLLLHAATYVLYQQLRTQPLQHTAVAQTQLSAVIDRLFKIASKQVCKSLLK